MKKLTLAFCALMAGAIILITLAELNLERAIEQCSKVDTDGQIEAVWQAHGFRIGINEEITPQEKIKALFR